MFYGLIELDEGLYIDPYAVYSVESFAAGEPDAGSKSGCRLYLSAGRKDQHVDSRMSSQEVVKLIHGAMRDD